MVCSLLTIAQVIKEGPCVVKLVVFSDETSSGLFWGSISFVAIFPLTASRTGSLEVTSNSLETMVDVDVVDLLVTSSVVASVVNFAEVVTGGEVVATTGFVVVVVVVGDELVVDGLTGLIKGIEVVNLILGVVVGVVTADVGNSDGLVVLDSVVNLDAVVFCDVVVGLRVVVLCKFVVNFTGFNVVLVDDVV